MEELSKESCSPVTEEDKPLDLQNEEELLSQLEGWFIDREGEHQLDKEYGFANFSEALSFANRVGAVAEQENHHPDILIHAYNRVALRVFSRTIKGLHRSDFILAAKIDDLVK